MNSRTGIQLTVICSITALMIFAATRVDLLATQMENKADSSGDTIFTEIHLSEDGVYGVDSSGNEWDYDFSRETFIRISDSSGETKTVFRIRKGDKLESDDHPSEPTDHLITTYDGLQMGSVEVDKGELVKSSITAVGPVTVRGIVTGDVTSYSKVTITSSGIIKGNVRAPQIVKMRGGLIRGSRRRLLRVSGTRIRYSYRSSGRSSYRWSNRRIIR